MKDTAASGKKPRPARTLTFTARLLGLAVCLFCIAMVIGDIGLLFEKGYTPSTRESLFVIVPVFIAAAAYMIAWRREMAGGVIMVLAYLLLSSGPILLDFIDYGIFRALPLLFLLASPLCISGLLFIIASRLKRARAQSGG